MELGVRVGYCAIQPPHIIIVHLIPAWVRCCTPPSEMPNFRGSSKQRQSAQDPAARARTDEAPGSPTGEFVSGTAVSPYEFGTDAVQQYHSQYPKISLPLPLVAHPGGGG
jgi:hypothetical protein